MNTGSNNISFTKLKSRWSKHDYIVFTEHWTRTGCVFTGYTVEENMCSKNTTIDIMCVHGIHCKARLCVSRTLFNKK